jgi:hypothetical protein
MQNNPYNPKKALWALLGDDDKKLFNNAKNVMTDAENDLSKREWAGDDTSYAEPHFTNWITGSVTPPMSMQSGPRSLT